MMLGSGTSAATITFGTGVGTPFSGSATEAGFTYSVLSGNLYSNVWGNPDRDMEGDSSGGGGVLKIVSAVPGLFTFSGLDYSAFSSNGTGSQTLNVSGMVSGSVVGSTSYLIANTLTFNPSYSNWSTFGAGGLTGINIDELRITLNGSFVASPFLATSQNVDNIQLGAAVAGAVPEPATWATMLTGFVLIGGALRRRRQAVRVNYAG